jgi:hypothetical protein
MIIIDSQLQKERKTEAILSGLGYRHRCHGTGYDKPDYPLHAGMKVVAAYNRNIEKAIGTVRPRA